MKSMNGGWVVQRGNAAEPRTPPQESRGLASSTLSSVWSSAAEWHLGGRRLRA